MAAPQIDPTYVCEETFERPTTAQITRPNPVFQDTVCADLLNNLHDTICAAWNGWEAACTFEDEAKQDYYMKIIASCGEMMKKVKKF